MEKTINEILNERSNKAVKDYGEELYHYTSFNALYNILNNKELWLGSTASMNDKEEIRTFIRKIDKALKNTEGVDTEKEKNLIDLIRKTLSSDYPFAFCLSQARDDAAQWERYAVNAQGVCIAFDTYNLTRCLFHSGGILGPVYYESNIFDHEHYKLLKKYLTEGVLDEFDTIEGLISNLLSCGCFFKHESFSTEREIRLSTLWGSSIRCSEDSIRCDRNQLRRIKKLHIDELCNEVKINFEDLISEIIIGPKSIQSIDELKFIIKSTGFKKNLKNSIVQSNCPLR